MISEEEHLSAPRRTRERSHGHETRPVAVILILASCILIALGVFGGAFVDVWQRASMVCYECIGIG